MAEDVPDFRPFDADNIERIWTQNILVERMYAVAKESRIDEMEAGGLENMVKAHAEQLKKAGVSTFEMTARHPRWLKATSYIPDYMIKAVGTHANILTLYEAIVEGRVPVNVAAHAMEPPDDVDKDGYFLDPELRTDELIKVMDRCSAYIRKHIRKFAKILNYHEDKVKFLNKYPLLMDPFDFAKAHNAILIGGGETPTEHYNMIKRGARYGVKAFPWWKQTPQQWGSQFAALSHIYKPGMVVCATGRIDEDNLKDTLETKYVWTVGGSSLFGSSPEETYSNTHRMVEIAKAAKRPK